MLKDSELLGSSSFADHDGDGRVPGKYMRPTWLFRSALAL